MSGTSLVASDKTGVLTMHGVADGSQIQEVLYPRNLSLLSAIASQKAFLVTNDCKIIDIAANEWPINIEAASDVRSVLRAPVKYGDELGVVAGVMDDSVMVRTLNGEVMASVQDLDPVMKGPNDEMMTFSGAAVNVGDHVSLKPGAQTIDGEPVAEWGLNDNSAGNVEAVDADLNAASIYFAEIDNIIEIPLDQIQDLPFGMATASEEPAKEPEMDEDLAKAFSQEK